VGLAVFGAIAHAQTTPEMVLNPWPQNVWGETVDKALYQEQGHIKGPSGDQAQIFWWDSIGRFRFSKTDERSPVIAYRYITTATDSNSPALPDHLDKLSLAGGLHLGEFSGGEFMLVGGAGYSGDMPFNDANGIFGIGHLLWERKMNDADSLVLSVDYDGGSALLPDVPLPGFQWVHRDEHLSYGVGYPRSFVSWEIIERLTLSANYAVPYTADAYLDYKIAKQWSVFGNVANFFEAYQLNEQPDTVRLFQQMSRVEVGVRYHNENVYSGLSLDAALAVGYAFGQSFSTGWDVRDLNETAEVSDEPYIALILRGTF
jgi:hypothetical protein